MRTRIRKLRAELKAGYDRRIELVRISGKEQREQLKKKIIEDAQKKAFEILNSAEKKRKGLRNRIIAQSEYEAKEIIDKAKQKNSDKLSAALAVYAHKDRDRCCDFVNKATRRLSKQVREQGDKITKIQVWKGADIKNAISDLEEVGVRVHTKDYIIEDSIRDRMRKNISRLMRGNDAS